jgi:hypothetical protein
MRSLKDVCEGLLAGQSSTLAAGDVINDQFEKIKSLITDPNAYDKVNRNTNMFLEIKDVKEVLSLVGLKNQKSLIISIVKRKEYIGWGEDKDYWFFDITIADSYDIKFKEPAKGLSFPKFLQKYIVPHFTNIESFAKFIKENI